MQILLPDAGLDAEPDAGQDVLQDSEPASCRQDDNQDGLLQVCQQVS